MAKHASLNTGALKLTTLLYAWDKSCFVCVVILFIVIFLTNVFTTHTELKNFLLLIPLQTYGKFLKHIL